MALKTCDLFVRQRTQAINALRGHLVERGVIAPLGTVHLERLQPVLADTENGLPGEVVLHANMILDQIEGLRSRIARLEKEIAKA